MKIYDYKGRKNISGNRIREAQDFSYYHKFIVCDEACSDFDSADAVALHSDSGYLQSGGEAGMSVNAFIKEALAEYIAQIFLLRSGRNSYEYNGHA